MILAAAILMAWSVPPPPPPERSEPAPVIVSLAAPVQEAPGTISQYSERERAATDLEQFRGGSEGLVVLIVVVVAVLVLIAIILPW